MLLAGPAYWWDVQPLCPEPVLPSLAVPALGHRGWRSHQWADRHRSQITDAAPGEEGKHTAFPPSGGETLANFSQAPGEEGKYTALFSPLWGGKLSRIFYFGFWGLTRPLAAPILGEHCKPSSTPGGGAAGH